MYIHIGMLTRAQLLYYFSSVFTAEIVEGSTYYRNNR